MVVAMVIFGSKVKPLLMDALSSGYITKSNKIHTWSGIEYPPHVICFSYHILYNKHQNLHQLQPPSNKHSSITKIDHMHSAGEGLLSE